MSVKIQIARSISTGSETVHRAVTKEGEDATYQCVYENYPALQSCSWKEGETTITEDSNHIVSTPTVSD